MDGIYRGFFKTGWEVFQWAIYVWRFLQSEEKNKKRKRDRQEDLPSKRRHVGGRRVPNELSKDNSKGYRYTRRDNKTPRTPFPRKSRDNLKEVSGTAYYNCGKEGHIARGYY